MAQVECCTQEEFLKELSDQLSWIDEKLKLYPSKSPSSNATERQYELERTPEGLVDCWKVGGEEPVSASILQVTHEQLLETMVKSVKNGPIDLKDGRQIRSIEPVSSGSFVGHKRYLIKVTGGLTKFQTDAQSTRTARQSTLSKTQTDLSENQGSGYSESTEGGSVLTSLSDH